MVACSVSAFRCRLINSALQEAREVSSPRDAAFPTPGAEPAVEAGGAPGPIDLWNLLWDYKLVIGSITFLAAVASVVIALVLTPVYRAEVLLAPAQEDRGSALSSIGNYFGGLASIAGIDLDANAGNLDEAIAILGSRAFSEEFIMSEGLIKVFYRDMLDPSTGDWESSDPEEIPTLADAFRFFDENVRFISKDNLTELVTLAIEWEDREEAARWANLLVERVNKRLRERAIAEAETSIEYLNGELAKTSVVQLQQAIYRLIEAQIQTVMLANVREHYAFKIIDPAVPPDADDEARPKKVQIVMVGTILGGLFGIALAMFLELRRDRRRRAL
jgi:hypothetical protein